MISAEKFAEATKAALDLVPLVNEKPKKYTTQLRKALQTVKMEAQALRVEAAEHRNDEGVAPTVDEEEDVEETEVEETEEDETEDEE